MGNRFPRKLLDFAILEYWGDQKGSRKSATHLPVKSRLFSNL
jgi:hypothetical protein